MKKRARLAGLASGIFHEKASKLRLDKFHLESAGSWQIEVRVDESRFYLFYLVIFVILFIFLARLFWLAILFGEKNREFSENNRIRLVSIEAERGKIFDREGFLLAESKRIYSLNKDNREIEITPKQVSDLENEGLAGENFSGELGKINQKVVRVYHLGKAASHVLGYTSVFQPQDIKSGADLSETVGRLGVEFSYDNFLRGNLGKKLIEVDANEHKIAVLGNIEPAAGRNIQLTIDASLQKAAYEILAKAAQKAGTKKGAVIVQNPKTGEVLAIVSVPSFEGDDIGKYISDLDKPFFNRVTLGTYPPGSVFKLVTAIAGLESGKITAETEIEDVGEFEISGTRFSNWFFNQHGGRDGILKIDKAIARSNDIFFYKVGQQTGLNIIREMAIKFGFGQKTGIDLPDEAYGLVPDEVWKKSTFGDDWFLGDTMHLAIGQGFMLVTPIQINSMLSYVAVGFRTQPFLVSKVDKGRAGEEIRLLGAVLKDGVSENSLKLVRLGMRKACQTGGTGWPFFNAPYSVGCKTGTAEKSLGNPHAWFSVFAPYDAPQIAMTVLIEEGGEGSSVAGPVAREIMDFWYKNK